jgi:hypothetical protein
VPVDDAVHTVEFSGEIETCSAGNRVVYLFVFPDDTPKRQRSFQVFGSGQAAPSNMRFCETVLAPTEELRWWHLFELNPKED